MGAPKSVCEACSKAVARADMSLAEPMKPRPRALVTAVARAAPAKPAMGALMMRGVVVQAWREEREGMVGWLVGEGEMRAKAMEVGCGMEARWIGEVGESFRVLDAVDLLSSAGVITAPRVPHITLKNWAPERRVHRPLYFQLWQPLFSFSLPELSPPCLAGVATPTERILCLESL